MSRNKARKAGSTKKERARNMVISALQDTLNSKYKTQEDRERVYKKAMAVIKEMMTSEEELPEVTPHNLNEIEGVIRDALEYIQKTPLKE